MKRLHIVSNSHLDREHRHEFQETRLMMVEMLDDVIRIMEEDPTYRYFTLDGQAIVLDDYLELRPQMRDRLTALIRAGRLQIGPWYSLVDCYSVMPESIIRNLLVGRQVCREYGSPDGLPMPVGYSIFSFGQMAQLPQIYAGFGIRDIVFYKGASAKALPHSEFIWEAPDGTAAFATRLGREKRWNFFFDFDIPVILGGDAKKPGWQSRFTDGSKLCHFIDPAHKKWYATELTPDRRIREEQIEPSLTRVLSLLDETLAEHELLGFDGTDFTSPLCEIPQIIRMINERHEGELALVHSTPQAYFAAARADIDPQKLQHYTGEMRFGPAGHVHCETMGTNTEIKQAIWHAENTIMQQLEPMTVMLHRMGGESDRESMRYLWKLLLSTHAHDSVHGSGDPKIKGDDLWRIAQAQALANSLLRRTGEALCRKIRFADDGSINVVIWNTTPYTRSEIVELTLDLPQEERVESFAICDEQGQPIDFYPLGEEKFDLASIHRTNRPKSVYCDRRTVLIPIEDLPGLSYRTLHVTRKVGSDATSTNPFPEGVFPYAPIAKSPSVMDNGRIRVTLRDGFIDVEDHETGLTASGLCAFESVGSSGDFWVHREPMHNTTVTSVHGKTKLELLENSALRAVCRMTCTMDIPRGLNAARDRRSAETDPVEVATTITVTRGKKRIDFVTELTNTGRDQLFSVTFPTGITAETADWEAPFEVRPRPIDPVTNDHLKHGPELSRQAMQGYLDVHGEGRGMALFTKGIREAETFTDGDARIRLTLFRACTGTFPIHNDLLIGFDEEPSQCLGPQRFAYAVQLHDGTADMGCACRLYQTDLLATEVGCGSAGDQPERQQLFSLSDPRVAVGAVKLCEEGDGYIVRLNDPYGEPLHVTLTWPHPVARVERTALDEEGGEVLGENCTALTLDIPAYKIVTLRVRERA